MTQRIESQVCLTLTAVKMRKKSCLVKKLEELGLTLKQNND